jgi:pyruvate dehydrogenase (quinone)
MEVAGFRDYQTDVKKPNYAKVAEAIGMMGVRIENPVDVSSGLLISANPVSGQLMQLVR